MSFLRKFSLDKAFYRTVCLALLMASSLLFCAHARASELTEGLGAPLGVPESKTVLKKLEELQKDLDSFSASARQKKRLSMLSEDIETEGRVLLKRPNLMRWETVSPERIIVTTDGKTMAIHHVDLKRGRSFELSEDFSARHAMSFFSSVMTSSFDGFSKDFFLSVFNDGGDIAVELMPRSKIWAKYFGGMTIWFNMETGVPSKFVVDWKKRGEVETVFDDIEVNPVVEEGAFDTKLPEDVIVMESDFDDEIE